MSQRLFKRRVAVTIGNASSSEAVRHDRLRVIFQVEKTSESNANTAKISVFNMSDRGRALAEKEKSFVLLEAGYGDRIEQLFYGDITRAYISHQGPDWVTTVECGEASNALRSVHIDKSYAPGTDLKQVVKDVAQGFVDQGKVVIGSLLGVKSQKSQSGLALSGPGQTILDDLAAKLGLEWSIQGNALQVLPRDKDLGLQAVLLSSATGLIGSPVRRELEGGQGVEFSALIQPQLLPGRLVRIESRHVTGLYKIRSVSFAGDTHGQPFYASGKAVAL
jgi:hypothetical protein